MAEENETQSSEMVIQEHCIDLPGESVQCWIGGGTDKLKVILRKHRDVVFDIQLGNGKTYVVETTESDFYNVRDKKLVYATRHDKVTFKDGERMHVWVSRSFRGSLILKCEDHVLTEVKPNEWDKHRYSADPKEKPAPIIVAIGHHPAAPKPIAQPSVLNHEPSHSEEQSLHVHEISQVGIPSEILKYFQDGGESLHYEKADIISRNWIFAQVAGAEAYLIDNRGWIKELEKCTFKFLQVAHKSGVKRYLVFSGNNKLREFMSGTKYGLHHTKVMRITGGAGGVKQTWDATKGAAKDSFKVLAKEEGKMVLKGTGLAVVLTISMDMAEWYKDYSEIGSEGKRKDFYDLAAKVGIDLVKAGLVAALTTATVATCLTVAATIAGAAAAPVILVVVGTIAITVALAYWIDRADKAIARTIGAQDSSTWVARKARDIAEYLSTSTKDTRYSHYSITRESPI